MESNNLVCIRPPESAGFYNYSFWVCPFNPLACRHDKSVNPSVHFNYTEFGVIKTSVMDWLPNWKISRVFFVVIHFPMSPLPSLKLFVMSVKEIKSASSRLIMPISIPFTCMILFLVTFFFIFWKLKPLNVVLISTIGNLICINFVSLNSHTPSDLSVSVA